MDQQITDARIIAYLRFARAVAGRVLDPRCHGADREDLVAWGVLGLVQAARRYRDDGGAPFSSYAARRVRGQVLDALRDRDPLTRSARRAYRAAREGGAELPPPVVEMSLDRCIAVGLEPPERDSARRVAAGPAPAPWTRQWSQVSREVRALAPLERKVLVLSYARGFTLREIGARIGLSESGVCRVRARALRRVRARSA